MKSAALALTTDGSESLATDYTGVVETLKARA